jgi:hypothetical protein
VVANIVNDPNGRAATSGPRGDWIARLTATTTPSWPAANRRGINCDRLAGRWSTNATPAPTPDHDVLP